MPIVWYYCAMSEEQPTVQYSPAPQQTSGRAIASMVLGICSILFCWAYLIPGLVCGILAVMFSKKAMAGIADGSAPEASAGMAKTGKICGWIGISLSAAYILFIIVYVVIIVGIMGAAAAAS